MLINGKFFLCMFFLAGLQAQGMTDPRIKLLGAAVAGFATRTFYADTKSEPVMVKPAWAVKHIPNGVPKELADQVEFIKNSEQFTKLGAELPKGMLLYGPPGTGKTSIVRAISEGLGASLVVASGTDFTSRYYGEGAKKVKSFFDTARSEARLQPQGLTIAFIDEIDVVTPNRSNERNSHGYGEQITAFLTEIDGFIQDKEARVYLIGATNRIESIDPAVLRSGRLEKHILIPLPTESGRADILRHYLKKISYHGNDISAELAKQTDDMSGADLKKLVNDAAILAGSRKASSVSKEDLSSVLQNLQMKKPKKTDPAEVVSMLEETRTLLELLKHLQDIKTKKGVTNV